MNDRAPSAAAEHAGPPSSAAPPAPTAAGAESPADRLTALLHQAGADAGRLLRVPAALSDGRWWTARGLVRHTAVAYRNVDAVLGALAADLEAEQPPQQGPARGAGRAEPQYRLRRGAEYSWAAALAAPDPAAGPLTDAEQRFPEAAAELARLVAEAPAPRADLDHVAATPGTALRRAAYLADHLALGGRRLLCVGDHDLTSLAALLVAPDAEAAVVDVDERMLDYIDGAAARLGLPVRCFFADLRLGIPAAAGGADLAFTDPPYTPDGVDLFVRRALQGLADPRRGRVAVAYGASETTPQLVKSTQARLARLDVLVEALLPEFNRYTGAEAIGASSDLYVLRGTAKNAPADPPERARIYSQGGNAKESAVRRAGARLEAAGPVGGGAAAAGADRAGRAADVHALLDGADVAVGPWDAEQLPEGVRPVGLRAWLTAPVPVERAAVVDLTSGWEGLLSRVLLAAGSGAVRALVRSTAPEVRTARGQAGLRDLLGPGRTVRFLAGSPAPGWTAVEVSATRASGLAPGAQLAAHCIGSAHGPLPRILREALIEQARASETAVNKRTARTLVSEHAPWTAGHTVLDLPAHRFADLFSACTAITSAAGLPE